MMIVLNKLKLMRAINSGKHFEITARNVADSGKYFEQISARDVAHSGENFEITVRNAADSEKHFEFNACNFSHREK